MKSAYSLFLFIVPLLLLSCEAPFNIDGPFRQRYVLNGIMNNDSTTQYVYISRTYRPTNETNPSSDTTDKFVPGCLVNIWYRDTAFTLRDTAVVRTDTSRYTDSVHFYYIKNLQPDPGKSIEIQAILPNGLLLKSSTEIGRASCRERVSNCV